MNKKISFAILIFILFLTVYLRWNDQNILTGCDPYYHYRKADEILNHEISDMDYLRNPPEGTVYEKNFYHYFTAYSYKLVPFLSLEEYMVYLPLIFSLLSVILAYKVGKLFNVYSGIFAAFFVAVTPIVVERTHKTFADTDSLVLLFALLLVYLYMKFLMTKKIVYLVFLGITLFILQSFWSGYWLFVYISLGSLFFYSLFKMRKEILNLKYFLIPSLVYIIPATLYKSTTLLFLLRLYRYNLNPAEIQKTFDVSQTVGELVNIMPNMLMPALGLILPLGLMGCVILLYLAYKEKRYYPVSLMLVLLLIFSVLTLQGGYRFLFLFAIPLLLLSSIFMGIVFQNIWRLKYRFAGIILILLSFSLCIYEIDMNKEIERIYPDEEFREALFWIDETLEEDAVIIAWWDYGYWIEALGKRASYVDNGYRPNSKLMWFAEMLTSEDTEMLRDLELSNLYIFLTERELYGFEMISYYLGERLEYMVRLPKKNDDYDFSTFYDEHLIFEKSGTVKIGKEGNFRPFNGYVYSMREYKVVFPSEEMPSRIFIVNPKLENVLFTEMYIRNAENISDIELIKEFKKIKVFKINIESEKDE
ncbi:MAG: hypothetical protein KAT49_06085 [Methanomicrobia archaeon]|nr:hypothetical protein [Methanomicrobia archaeon]